MKMTEGERKGHLKKKEFNYWFIFLKGEQQRRKKATEWRRKLRKKLPSSESQLMWQGNDLGCFSWGAFFFPEKTLDVDKRREFFLPLRWQQELFKMDLVYNAYGNLGTESILPHVSIHCSYLCLYLATCRHQPIIPRDYFTDILCQPVPIYVYFSQIISIYLPTVI